MGTLASCSSRYSSMRSL